MEPELKNGKGALELELTVETTPILVEQVQRQPRIDVLEAPLVEPAAPAPPARTNGAIFQADRYRPLFEDHRARMIGDTLTVTIDAEHRLRRLIRRLNAGRP